MRNAATKSLRGVPGIIAALANKALSSTGSDGADVDQRHGDLLAPCGHRQVLISIGKTKLEAQIGRAVTVIVHLDFIDGFGIEIEVIRTAVSVLQRDIIGNKSYLAATPGLVAAKHVEVGSIDSRLSGNGRRLSVTGGDGI